MEKLTAQAKIKKMVFNNAGSIATARWADPDYIANKYFYKDGDVWIGRNPHNFEQGIGYKDERHMIVCAGNRSGKGRSFIVNNLALWEGSTITYDPKGELPIITAPRRGDGDQYCEGMGQDVFVLDPLGHSGIDEKYLGYFDPLSALDPEDKDGELATWAKRIANSLIEIPDSGESSEWAKRAVRLIALIIMHVMTSDRFKRKQKNLMTVLKLILEGDTELHEIIQKQHPDIDIGNPLKILLENMEENKACRGWIASDARNLLQQMEEVPKYFESVRGEASDRLDWFKSAGIEYSLTGKVTGEDRPKLNAFDPARLKTDPKGVSVYIVMPVEDLKTYGPWVQTVFTGIFAAVRRHKGKPATGHQILTFLDEFSSLGYQEYIASSLDNIAGEGMKLAIIMQNFGKLKKLYGDEMESFFTNAGLELYFGKVGQTALEYIKKELGETEVVKLARSKNFSKATGTANSTAIGEAKSEGGSASESETHSFGESEGKSWNWSKNVNYSDSKNWGKSNGESMGRNYGPHVFHLFPNSKSFGTNLNRNSGGSHTQGKGRTKGGGGNKSTTETHGTNKTTGSSWNTGTSYTETNTNTETETIGGGVAESFHKKPLLEPHEFNAFFNPVDWSDKDHPAYPGFALVRIQGEHPFFVRRSNYDQDPYFEKLFSADPVHGYLPLNEVPLLGYQYTEDHIFAIKFPEMMVKEKTYSASPLLRPLQNFKEDNELFSFTNADKANVRVRAPFSGRVMTVANDDQQKETGEIMTVKADRPINEQEKTDFKRGIFENCIKHIKRIMNAKNRKEQTQNEITELDQKMKLTTEQINRFEGQTETALYKHLEKGMLGWFLLPVILGFSFAGDVKGFWASTGTFFLTFIIGTAIVIGVLWLIAKGREVRWSGVNQEADKLRNEYRQMAKKKQDLEDKL